MKYDKNIWIKQILKIQDMDMLWVH